MLADIDSLDDFRSVMFAMKNGTSDKSPVMVNVASNLSDEEIEQLSLYMSTLP